MQTLQRGFNLDELSDRDEGAPGLAVATLTDWIPHLVPAYFWHGEEARPEAARPHVHWEISRLTGTPARVLGTVEAPDDQEKAIRAGIEQFGITNPAQQARLSARKLRPAE